MKTIPNSLKLIFTFCILFLSAVITTFAQEDNFYFKRAKEMHEAKDYKYALIMIEKALDESDTFYQFYFAKSRIEWDLGRPDDALNTSLLAMKKFPDNSESYSNVGFIYEYTNRIDSGIYYYNKAIEHSKNDTNKYNYVFKRGTAKISKRDFDAGMQDFDTVLKYFKDDVYVLNNVANVIDEIGKSYEALKIYLKIDSLEPGNVIFTSNIGFAYSHIDSFEQSLKYFNKAIEIDPDAALAYNNRGYTYYKLGRYKNALEDINKSISMYPSNSYAYRNLALVYIAQNNMKEACIALKYATAYKFKLRYGNEVEELQKKHCAK